MSLERPSVLLAQLGEIFMSNLPVDLLRLWVREDPAGEFGLWLLKGESRGLRDRAPLLGLRLTDRRQSLSLDDLQSSRVEAPESVDNEGLVSFLGIPLWFADRSIGALELITRRRLTFSTHEIALAEALGGAMASAVGNALEAPRNQLREREAVRSLAKEVGSNTEIRHLLARIAQLASCVCFMERCTIQLLRDGWMEPATLPDTRGRVAGGRRQPHQWLRKRKVDELPFFKEVERRLGYVTINDPLTNPLWPRAWAAFASKLVLVVPLVRQREVLGVMLFGNSRRAGSVTPEQITSATTIASQAALAISNSRLSAEVKRQADQTEAQIGIARALGSTRGELKPLLVRIARLAARACNSERCSIFLRVGEQLIPTTSQHADGREDRSFAEMEELQELPLFEEILRRKGHVSIDDPWRDKRWPATFPRQKGTKVLLAPLKRENEVVGVMALEGRDVISHETVAQTIASQVTLTLDNARRYWETQALLDVAQAVGKSLDRHEIARQSCRHLTRLLGADCALFYEVDEGQCRIAVAGYHVPESIRDLGNPLPLQEQGTFIVEAVDAERPVAGSEIMDDARFGNPPIAILPPPRALLCAPVLARGKPRSKEWGGLLAFWWDKPHTFTDEEHRIAEGIADQMALVLENARQYEKIQQALTELKATQERLVQAERLRALAEMAGGVAHDFNNLLTAIGGHTQLLRAALKSPQQASKEVVSHLASIELVVGDGAKTVRRLLEDYSRSGSKPKVAEVVHVNDLLAQTVELARPRWESQATESGVHIDIVIEPGEAPSIRANPAELREVLLNLIYNAIDAIPQAGKIILSSRVEAGQVWICVTDTGEGMTEEVRRKVFEPFFTTKLDKGTGLGLSASYGIIHRHGGKIDVNSVLGQGTTFTIKLPL